MMMVGMRLKGLVVILLLGVLLLSSNFSSCNARRGKHWRKSGYHRSGGGGGGGGSAARATLFKKKTQSSTYKGSGSSGGSSKGKMKHGSSSSSKQVPPAPSMGIAVPPSLPPSAPPPLHYSPSPSPSHSHDNFYPSPSASPSPSHTHYNYNPSPTPAPTAKSFKSPPSSKAPLKSPPTSSSPSSKAPLKPPPTSSSPSSKAPLKPPPTGGSHSLPPPPPKRSSSLFYPPPPPPPKSNPNGKAKPTPSPATEDAAATVFSVLDFGANGDGTSDDTKAFQAAWAAACKVEASTVLVPPEYTFLVGPISFSGPYCQPNIVFQLEGTIIAPTSAKAWGSGLLQWLEFTKLRGITIQGGGVIEGRGAVWWSTSQFDFMPISNELATFMPRIKPTALRFYGSYNVTVTGITIQNSPQCHLKFDSCQAVEAYNITISSPADSLNTDGIHLQNSKDVSIHHNTLGCGDDCVSIQTGCTNININHLTCGPGHGISIGGLGRDNTKACVSNITVQNVDLSGTMTGVRIKTWQGGSGSVQNVRFSNIRVDEVQTPIVIDQFYCDRATCRNQTAAVAVQGVSYQNVRGTFTVKPVHLACSDSTPCSDITLDQIQLQPVQERYRMFMPFCWQAYGQLRSPTLPPIPIQLGKPARNELLSDPDTCVI